ncbi:MAG: glycosyltransferase family 2 protein [Rhodobacteraceae bacterium]|jgi:hypothetical protein|nr:glycosyltransferase family 2 protein [Paracoccaceae bacterium]
MRILSVTGVKDEGPFLLEWLAWHRLIGITDFLVFSNECSDGTDRMLDLLQGAGLLIHCPHSAPAGSSVQWQGLSAAWAHPLRQAADWMLVSDVDEFPMVHAGQHRLPDLIAALPEGTEAVALAWRLFGNSGAIRFADRPVTQQFDRCAPDGMQHPVAATFFKSLFRPAAFAGPGVHRPAQLPGRRTAWVDGSGAALPETFAADGRRLSLYPAKDLRRLAEMHHYSLRSAESFVVKSARGLPNRGDKAIDLAYWVERNFNTGVNRAAEALTAPLAEAIAALKAIPGVAETHVAACAWHRAAFLRLVAEPGPYRLFTGCIHAAQSAALPDTLATELYRMFQRVGTPTG